MFPHTITPMATYIDKIGVELELAVKKTENGYPEVPAFEHTADGSISTPREASRQHSAREYVSKPIEYSSKWDDEEMSDLEAGIHALYRKHDAMPDRSMGTHVHVSFNKDYYYHALASMKFYEFFMQRVEDSRLYDQYQPLRRRAEGVNYAEKLSGHEEIQSSMTGSRQYRHFTYRSERKTIEFRLMPSFESKRQVMDAVEIITSAVNSYLFNKHHEFEEEAEVVHDSSEQLDEVEADAESVSEVIEYV